MPENLPETDDLTPLSVSLFKRPVVVNPVKVFVVPSNSVDPDRPLTVALVLLIVAKTAPPVSV